jgi:hypothetical protein
MLTHHTTGQATGSGAPRRIKRLALAGAGLTLAIAAGSAAWYHGAHHASHTYPAVVVPATIAAPTSSTATVATVPTASVPVPYQPENNAPVVFVAPSAEAASTFRADLLQANDGERGLQARVIAVADAPALTLENGWRTANNLAPLAIFDLAAPE